MGQTDPSLARMKTILALFVFVFIFNTIAFVFLELDEPYKKVTDESKYESGLDSADYPKGSITDIISIIATIFKFISFFFGGFLVFTAPTLPFVMAAIITPIYLITIITFWYLVIDFIKDISILGSHL